MAERYRGEEINSSRMLGEISSKNQPIVDFAELLDQLEREKERERDKERERERVDFLSARGDERQRRQRGIAGGNK